MVWFGCLRRLGSQISTTGEHQSREIVDGGEEEAPEGGQKRL
jgi:hypothetical protein